MLSSQGELLSASRAMVGLHGHLLEVTREGAVLLLPHSFLRSKALLMVLSWESSHCIPLTQEGSEGAIRGTTEARG